MDCTVKPVVRRKGPRVPHQFLLCPLVTARDRMLLCEFDYSLQPHPTIPMIDTTHERYDMWLLKRYGLLFMYWNLILKGRA